MSFNGRVWVLSVAIEIETEKEKLNDFTVGVDLGIKALSITNRDELDAKNINKTQTVRQLEKKLKKLQKQCSRKHEMNKKGESYQKTKNILKLEKRIKKLHRRLAHIRENHIHQATAKIVKTKPFSVVMEDLKVSNMLKNKHLSQAIAKQGFNTFIQVPTFYPSSKMCSGCGNLKKDLKLSDRNYKCQCGFIADRDKNASYNLAKYGLEISA